MEESPTQNPGDPGVEPSKEKASDGLYELDLEEHAPADIDEAIKDAVAAVDRVSEHTDAEGSASDVSASPADDTQDSSKSARPQAEDPVPQQRALESEAEGLRERLMRTLADFDNYRKRADREKQTLRKFANFDVFKDFLGVLDNLERAMESSGSTDDLKQGLRMIVRQQEEILRRHGVQRVDAVDQPFDPKVHEAVAREESSEVETPTVTKEMQRGYLLHDRLLRPAMVFVAMPGAKPNGEGNDSDGEATD